jgi:MFS family permease
LVAFVLSSLPLYAMFFLWGLGTGAQQLARPLFAASFGVPIFLVSLIQASNSLAWLFSGPVTGYLTDRFGRRPLTIFGNGLRAVTMVGQFYCTDYVQFFVLEFIGGIGVATWLTGSSIIMADVTDAQNRGRAMAVRTLTMKVGLIAGLFLGGLLASIDIRAIFMFGAITKIPIHLLLARLIKETLDKDEPDPRPAGATESRWAMARLMFLNTPVLILAITVFTISAVGSPQGVFGSLFPILAQDMVGLSPNDIGQLLGLAGIAGVIVSFPNGVIADRYGRKASLIPGLAFLAVASYGLTLSGDYWTLFLAAMIYGIGDGITQSTAEVTAMDMAPAQGRGTFLGVWSVFRNIGGIAAPMLVGGLAGGFGMQASFVVIAALLVASAFLMTFWGLETHPRRPRTAPTQGR